MLSRWLLVSLALTLACGDDALPAAAGEHSVWTFGRLDLEPNAPSIVPGRARLTVQWRDPPEEGWLLTE